MEHSIAWPLFAPHVLRTVARRKLWLLLALLLSASCERGLAPDGDGEAEPQVARSASALKLPKPSPLRRHRFHLEEATIGDIQRAIQTREISCEGVVRAYLERARAYNGVCTQLITQDGAPVPAASGYVRAGAPIAFPTSSVPISALLPNLDQYVGPPIDLGRMEPTATDPGVLHQVGMLTGIPHAGQLNALETLNIRGERSQTCKGMYDAPPASGPLPPDAPPRCQAFRQLPDALERAAELDAKYGSHPDLDELPLYCTVFSIKDWYDSKDMRGTGGNDVAFAMDAPPVDSTLVAELRAKGAIIYAVSVASQVNNTSNGPIAAERNFVPSTDNARATWGGAACNPYDTTRNPGFSSGGAGASVSANLVTCGICETTGGSCRIPANANGVASIVTTKGIISSDHGWTAQHVNHRPGILCRNLGDAALVLDALKNPDSGYFDPGDMFTALPQALIPKQPYASFIVGDARGKPLAGTRVGVVREFMVKANPNNVAIVDAADAEFKSVLRDRLGATLIESVDPLYPDDPTVTNMSFTFSDAFSEIVALNAPEYFFQMAGGALEFAVPGYDVTSKDYMVKLALLQAPLSAALNLRRITNGLDNAQRTAFLMDKYLLDRADPKVSDWKSFVANATFFASSITSGSQNTAQQNVQDIRATSGIDRLKMVSIARMVVTKVMLQNKLDVLVFPNIPAPNEKNEYARDPVKDGVRHNGPPITDLLGCPEVIVPSGFNLIVYEASYQLNAAKNGYDSVPGTVQAMLPNPMPTSIMFLSTPGEEPEVLRVASAYEAATHHRTPPPDFGPLPGEP